MTSNSFDWTSTRQLSPVQILLSFVIPSGIAYIGFHSVLPNLVQGGMPVLVAWPIVASAMLAVFAFTAVLLLKNEAAQLGISVAERMCLKRLPLKQWTKYIAVMIAGLMLAGAVSQMVGPFIQLTGIEIPAYMPFFLNPTIDPMNAGPETLSPGLALEGAVFILPLFALALLLNILAEELYFRAWLLPKMSRYGHLAWLTNGLLFALYHTFQLWLFPVILVGSLIWAYVIYSSKSIYPALAGHFVGNFIFSLLGLTMLVLA